MKLQSMKDLLVDQLRDLLNAENQLLRALPKMAKAASSSKLQDAFEQHLEQTEGQVARLEKVFEALELKPRGKKCHAMEGLIEEGKEIIEEDADPEVRDAALIAAAQKVEHYEIAAYGCARTFALTLGEEVVADLLQETLDEEKETDEKLTELAQSGINREAADGKLETVSR